MSFNKLFVPELEYLQESLKNNGSHQFFKQYVNKRDAFIGPSEAVEFLDKYIERYDKAVIEFFEI